MNTKEYIGDGLFASFDGFGIELSAPRIGGDHFVYLEPSTLDAFEQYVKRLREQAKQPESQTSR